MHHLPNLICVLRMALAPWCGVLILKENYGEALGLFFIAGWTDFLDGYLARRFEWNSAAGAYLDPLADKVLMAVVYLALWLSGAIPTWLAALVFGRDLLILIGAGVVSLRTRVRKFPPSWYGKVSTTIQILAAGFVLGAKAEYSPAVVATVLIYAAGAGTLISGADYLLRGIRMLRQAEAA